MLEFFNENIEPENEKLAELLGIKRITVKDESDTTQLVRAINPSGKYVFITEEKMRKCETLGLSMRRV